MTFEEMLARFFDQRILLCEENINDACVGRLRSGFLGLNLLSREKPIRLAIDIRGGDVDEALRLVGTMDMIDAPIIGLVDGRCDVLGLALLQTCDVRLVTRFPSITIQKIFSSSSFYYTGNDLVEKHTLHGKHLDSMQKQLDTVIVGRREDAGLRSTGLQELYGQHAVVFGEDLARMGFADEVVDSEGFWTGEDVVIPGRIGFHRG